MNPLLSPQSNPYGSSSKDDVYFKMVDEIEDYAILMLDREGHVMNWNKGAEKIKGYTEQEILSKHFRIFIPRKISKIICPKCCSNRA